MTIPILISPNDICITLVHCSDTNCPRCRYKQKTMEWLRKTLEEKGKWAISTFASPIVIVIDPVDEKKFVYDGNIRVSFARERNLDPIEVITVVNQAELDGYVRFYRGGKPSWFGIRDFAELLEYMRIYAQFPNADDNNMPLEWKERIKQKCQQRQEILREEWRQSWHFGEDD